MRRLSFLLLTIATVAAVASCQKSEFKAPKQGNDNVVIRAYEDKDNSRVAITGTMFSWEMGDKLTACKYASTPDNQIFTSLADGKKVDLEGALGANTAESPSDYVYAVYPNVTDKGFAMNNAGLENETLTYKFTAPVVQEHKFAANLEVDHMAIDSYTLMYGRTGEMWVGGEQVLRVGMKHLMTFFDLKLSGLVNTPIHYITLRSDDAAAFASTINFNITPTTKTAPVAVAGTTVDLIRVNLLDSEANAGVTPSTGNLTVRTALFLANQPKGATWTVSLYGANDVLIDTHNKTLTNEAPYLPGQLYSAPIGSTTTKIGVTTLAGKGGAAGSNDGTLLEARFNTPKGGLAVDHAGNILVTDSWGKTLRLISQSTNSVTTLECDGATLRQPTLLSDGKTFYVSTWDDARINSYSAESQWKPQYKGALVKGQSYESFLEVADKLPGKFIVRSWLNPVFTIPQTDITPETMVNITTVGTGSASWMCYNPLDSYIYLTIEKTYNIWRAKLNNDGTLGEFAVWAGSSNGTSGHKDGALNEALFSALTAIVADSKGNLFVADCYNHVIRKITPEGVVSTVVGAANEPDHIDGKPNEARLNQPHGLAIDKNDHLYIAELENHCIRKVILE